ncbi:3-hydroxyacyl-CoA dehydrogenase, partial [Francisella tularensis subsp. holarctica]|nr:3-hydroxyacyl-CoA dehydrogenase [Francisella tularensis subsp. holarctica]
VGLDVLSNVFETMKDNIEDCLQKLYNTHNWIQNLINNGSLCQKTKKGLYIKASDCIKVLDLGTNEYRSADKKDDKEILD